MTEATQTPAPPAAEPSRASLTIQALLAILVSLAFAGAYVGAFVTSNVGLVHDLTELLKMLLVAVFSYYFGSSVGSRLKGAAGQGQGHG